AAVELGVASVGVGGVEGEKTAAALAQAADAVSANGAEHGVHHTRAVGIRRIINHAQAVAVNDEAKIAAAAARGVHQVPGSAQGPNEHVVGVEAHDAVGGGSE